MNDLKEAKIWPCYAEIMHATMSPTKKLNVPTMKFFQEVLPYV